MPHGLDNCQPVLRRWAAHSDGPLPTDWKDFQGKNTAEAIRIQQADPELASLLSGQAPAGLKADALGGKLSPVPPDLQKMAQQQRANRIAELTASNPFGGPGQKGNMSHAIELYELDPAKAKRLEQEAHPEPTFEQKRAMQQQQRMADQAIRNQSMQHTAAQLRAQHRGY